MYQGLSDRFQAPCDVTKLPSEDDGIDFEGEFGVICKATPMGTKGSAKDHIALVVQINHWSLRKLGPIEMKTGFGWVQAKPVCSMAPVAVTPDELGAAWRDLPAGTVIGSGTVSNANFRYVGSACIAKRRGIETLDDGEAKTPFMSFGDDVHMECVAADGSPIFGAIAQQVVKAWRLRPQIRQPATKGENPR